MHLLGLVDFDAILGLQEQIIYEVSGQLDTSGVLFLCEHPPLITMGRQATRTDLLLDDQELLLQELPVRWVSRGGGAYVHAPGQLAAYLFVPLNRLQVGVSAYRSKFETAVQDTCRELKVPAKRRDEESGVWGRSGHLAYFGGSIRNWVSCFGMYLNVDINTTYLRMSHTNPVGEQATSIQAQRLQPLMMSQVRESLIRHISEQFDYTLSDVCTGHPQLKRTTRRISVHA